MSKLDQSENGPRKALKMLAIGSSTELFSMFSSAKARAEKYEAPGYQKGAPPVTITKVRAITTAPEDRICISVLSKAIRISKVADL